MKIGPWNRLCWTIFWVFLCMLSGCADSPFGDLSVMNPFQRPAAEDVNYGPTPSEKIAQLKRIAARAGKMTPQQQDSTSRDLLGQMYNEVDPLIRTQIVLALAAFPTPAATEGLKQAIGDNEAQVRIAACRAWRKRGGADAIAALANVIASDTDLDVRMAAARALADFQDPTAYRALSVALDDEDPALQHRAIRSLQTASGRDFGNDLDAWRQFAEGGTAPLSKTPSLVERLRSRF